MTHTCHLSTWEVEAEDQMFKIVFSYIVNLGPDWVLEFNETLVQETHTYTLIRGSGGQLVGRITVGACWTLIAICHYYLILFGIYKTVPKQMKWWHWHTYPNWLANPLDHTHVPMLPLVSEHMLPAFRLVEFSWGYSKCLLQKRCSFVPGMNIHKEDLAVSRITPYLFSSIFYRELAGL